MDNSHKTINALARTTYGRTDRGVNNIPIDFKKKRGDNKHTYKMNTSVTNANAKCKYENRKCEL